LTEIMRPWERWGRGTIAVSFLQRARAVAQQAPRLAEGARVALLFARAVPFVNQVRIASKHYRAGEFEAALAAARLASELADRWQALAAETFRGDEEPSESELEAALKDNSLVAKNLHLLGQIHFEMGDYDEALPHLERAVEIFRRMSPKMNLGLSEALHPLATTHLNLGDHETAERLFEEALAIREQFAAEHMPRLLSPLAEYDHGTARVRMSLAMMHVRRGRLDDAEAQLSRAESAFAAQAGRNQVRLAEIALMRAFVAVRRSDFDSAAALAAAAVDGHVAALGERHPDYGRIVGIHGVIRGTVGDFAGAEQLHRRADAIVRASLGAEHDSVAENLHNLAVALAAVGRLDEALEVCEEADSLRNPIVADVLAVAPQGLRTTYLEAVRESLSIRLSLLAARAPHSAVHDAYRLVLARKGLGAEAAIAQRQTILAGRYPELRDDLDALVELERRIAAKRLAGPGPESPTAHAAQLESWATERDRLDAQLVRQVPEMRLASALAHADVESVAQRLPADATLLEFLRFDTRRFGAVAAAGETLWGRARYAAFVLPAGRPQDLRFVDLGEAEPIEREIVALTDAIRYGARKAEARAAQALQRLILDPALGPSVRGRVLVAPDGELFRVPFEALLDDDGVAALDRGLEISYLTSGREVLGRQGESPRTPSPPIVAADPDFDLGSTANGGPSPCTRRLPMDFTRLDHTREEGKNIGDMLGVRPLLGDEVLEADLKACSAPRIIHIATHGFFLKDERPPPPDPLAGVGLAGRVSVQARDNPLLRCGLALAGASCWARGGTPPADAEDGLLTGEDVNGLDLLGTELVVLSACDTALGEVHVGEGIAGLRRAFVQAGAKTLLISLWHVGDRATRLLMEAFYERLKKDAGALEALRGAQVVVRREFPDTRDWAGFILQGEVGRVSLR
jgi:CHAT domain-containing protein